MRKGSLALLALLLLLLPVLTAAEPEPATPTDLTCGHEHIRTTIYFFDSPVYMPVGEDAHRVSGPATVETVCLDCGEVLSSEIVSSAEEICPHSIKKGVCVLCGYRMKDRAGTSQPGDAEGERTIYAMESGNANGLLELTLTREDLSGLKRESISTLLIRGRTGAAAIALQVDEVLEQLKQADTVLYMELEEQEDGSLFAGLYLISGSDVRTMPEENGITLRFYREKRTGARASLAPADKDKLVETESVWSDRGYWSVQYLEEGTYFVLQ